MKLQAAIDGRHSIREFEKEKVPKSILKKVIKNATKAPSACNGQPWKFYVVSSRENRDKISILTRKEFEKIMKNNPGKSILKKEEKIQRIAEKFYNNLGDAPCIILIYREKQKNEPSYLQPNDISGISAAVENLMLSAVEEGLGTCWVGTIKGFEKKLNKLLCIPDREELIASILIGYPKKGSKILIRKKKKLNEVLKFI
jgi:nitroreductase